jgi:hypothetical protein
MYSTAIDRPCSRSGRGKGRGPVDGRYQGSLAAAVGVPGTPHEAAGRSDGQRSRCSPRTGDDRSASLSQPIYAAAPHRCCEAILAPSAMARNFAHVTVGTTTSIPAIVPKPQSVPAITLSRPTTSA